MQQQFNTKIPPKTIHLVRHGQSLHNAHYHMQSGADMNDARYIDAPLTPLGESQAHSIAPIIANVNPDLFVCSPLTRATQTLLHARSNLRAPIAVTPLCSERVAYSCDIGNPVSLLRNRFPGLDYSQVPNPEEWWWMPPELKDRTSMGHLKLMRKDPPGACQHAESREELARRASQFRTWLLHRPETNIAVFAHGVFLTMLVGDPNVRFRNCEIKKIVL